VLCGVIRWRSKQHCHLQIGINLQAYVSVSLHVYLHVCECALPLSFGPLQRDLTKRPQAEPRLYGGGRWGYYVVFLGVVVSSAVNLK
jgi:hypothetical protein